MEPSPPLSPPTLATAIENLRLDLFDQLPMSSADSQPRWKDADLARALDRALDEYSFVAPLIQSLVMPMTSNTVTYPFPDGAWWIESIIYPYINGCQLAVSFEESVAPYDPRLNPSIVSPSNMTIPANSAQFTLQLRSEQVPRDEFSAMKVTYACKHLLVSAGTTLSERDHDIVLLGAAAYALLAFQAGQNDLFEYQDGEMRDRVDERTVPAAWLTAGNRALGQFHDRLAQVENQRNAGAAAVSHWGSMSHQWRWI